MKLPPSLICFHGMDRDDSTVLTVFQYLQAEHASLRSDLKELVTENRHLSDKLKNVVSTKFKMESNVSPSHKKECNMLTNLQQQLSVVAQVSCFFGASRTV